MDEPSLQRLTQGQKRSIRLVFRNAAKERENKNAKRDCDRQTDVALKEKKEKEKKQPYPCTRAAGSVLTGQGQGPGRQVRSEPCQSSQVDPSIRSVRQTKKWPQDPARGAQLGKSSIITWGEKSSSSLSLSRYHKHAERKGTNEKKETLLVFESDSYTLHTTHYTPTLGGR